MAKVFETYTTNHKDGTFGIHPISSSITEEYVSGDLYLTDELIKDEHDSIKTYYRLHAKKPHNNTMALAYDVFCPKCKRKMRQITDNKDFYTLGYYECKNCNHKGGHR